MKLWAQGFSTNRRQGLVGTVVVLTDDDQPTGIEHLGNYSRDGDKGLYRKLQDAGYDPELVKPKLRELLSDIRGVPTQRSPLPTLWASGLKLLTLLAQTGSTGSRTLVPESSPPP